MDQGLQWIQDTDGERRELERLLRIARSTGDKALEAKVREQQIASGHVPPPIPGVPLLPGTDKRSPADRRRNGPPPAAPGGFSVDSMPTVSEETYDALTGDIFAPHQPDPLGAPRTGPTFDPNEMFAMDWLKERPSAPELEDLDIGVDPYEQAGEFLPVPLVGDMLKLADITGGGEGRTDAFGVDTDLLTDGDADAVGSGTQNAPDMVERITTDLQAGDTSRGGQAVDKTARTHKIFPKGREKVMDWFGLDDSGAVDLGQALMAGGAGILTGGTDIGAAIGHGFSKGLDQFVAKKQDRRDAALTDIRIQREEQRLEMDRLEMERSKKLAIIERNSGLYDPKLTSLKQKRELAAIGIIPDGQGGWKEDPDWVPALNPKGNFSDARIAAAIEGGSALEWYTGRPSAGLGFDLGTDN